jgi:hypothetical protein
MQTFQTQVRTIKKRKNTETLATQSTKQRQKTQIKSKQTNKQIKLQNNNILKIHGKLRKDEEQRTKNKNNDNNKKG